MFEATERTRVHAVWRRNEIGEVRPLAADLLRYDVHLYPAVSGSGQTGVVDFLVTLHVDRPRARDAACLRRSDDYVDLCGIAVSRIGVRTIVRIGRRRARQLGERRAD